MTVPKGFHFLHEMEMQGPVQKYYYKSKLLRISPSHNKLKYLLNTMQITVHSICHARFPLST